MDKMRGEEVLPKQVQEGFPEVIRAGLSLAGVIRRSLLDAWEKWYWPIKASGSMDKARFLFVGETFKVRRF
jgi:hypothetical protein